VSRTAHWWCDDIQALYEAGACDGLILGNHGAIERALHDRCGEVKSLLEWFTHGCEAQESSENTGHVSERHVSSTAPGRPGASPRHP
jgi:hypothetical protein